MLPQLKKKKKDGQVFYKDIHYHLFKYLLETLRKNPKKTCNSTTKGLSATG